MQCQDTEHQADAETRIGQSPQSTNADPCPAGGGPESTLGGRVDQIAQNQMAMVLNIAKQFKEVKDDYEAAVPALQRQVLVLEQQVQALMAYGVTNSGTLAVGATKPSQLPCLSQEFNPPHQEPASSAFPPIPLVDRDGQSRKGPDALQNRQLPSTTSPEMDRAEDEAPSLPVQPETPVSETVTAQMPEQQHRAAGEFDGDPLKFHNKSLENPHTYLVAECSAQRGKTHQSVAHEAAGEKDSGSCRKRKP